MWSDVGSYTLNVYKVHVENHITTSLTQNADPEPATPPRGQYATRKSHQHILTGTSIEGFTLGIDKLPLVDDFSKEIRRLVQDGSGKQAWHTNAKFLRLRVLKRVYDPKNLPGVAKPAEKEVDLHPSDGRPLLLLVPLARRLEQPRTAAAKIVDEVAATRAPADTQKEGKESTLEVALEFLARGETAQAVPTSLPHEQGQMLDVDPAYLVVGAVHRPAAEFRYGTRSLVVGEEGARFAPMLAARWPEHRYSQHDYWAARTEAAGPGHLVEGRLADPMGLRRWEERWNVVKVVPQLPGDIPEWDYSPTAVDADMEEETGTQFPADML
ncbi:hypothetical protein C8A03DRAFT_37615 [Achaetomium macrosporum]|uniref:Uncharacterized protein n=1 Tax=Achaetomium macrosporum TaxID=79813 RepID=A0AAN7C3K1_9PEZI|nr:hypothetical protein C8A03DRAFT_37615 [Achaetomium macrosporum]